MAETDDDQRLLDSIQLAMVPGVGPQISQALLARFETAGRALEASRGELLSVSGVGPKIAEKIARARQDFEPPPSWPCAGARASVSFRVAIPNIPRRSRTYPTHPASST